MSSITNPASKTVNFEYNSSNYLEKITYADGKATVFSYDSNGITRTTAPDGTYVKYSYDLINNHLYTKSLEYYGSNDVLNTDYDFEYQHNNTIITSDCDNTINNTYQFNNFGKTTGVVNNKSGTAEYYEYGAPGGATGTENKLLGVSNTVFASASVINDNSFSNAQKFYVDPEATDTVVSVDNTKGRNNAPSLKVQQTGEYGGNTAVIYDLGTLKGGYNYTFKVYINTGDTVINGYTGISFYGFRYDAEGYKNYDFYSTSVAETFDDGWVAISVTHGFSEDTHYYLSIGGYIASPATFWIDDLQVELGDGTDNYNYLNDSAFIQGGTEWVYKRNGTVSTDSSIKYYTDVGFGINGSPNETRSCSQVASCVGNAGDVLCFGAWAVAISAPTGNGNNSTFRIRVELSGPSGNAVFTSDENILNFNFALEEWQLASKYLIAPIDFTNVTFYLDYDYNLNFALFHRPFLYKEEFGQSYSYDSNGNVVSTKDLAQTEATFAYQNNNLSQMIEPTGSRYSYSYDEQTNALMYANSSDGQLFAFTYDSFGNVLSTTATALTNATQLNTDSVYYIRNVTTGNAMKNANALLTNGTYATQNNSIRWKLVSAGETDVYYVQSFADTGKYLTVKDGSTADKAEIILSDLANSDSQKFKVSAVGDGTFKLLTKVSGYAKAIDSRDLNNGGSTELNKGMVQNALDNTNAYQKWYFTPYVESENVQSINSSATYTADGNYLQTSTDTFGNVSSYQYNADGSVSSETNAKNVSANYTYDENSGNLLTVTSGNSTNKYTYENDRLKTIETANGTVYTFNYDAFGRNKSITLNRKNSTATDRTLVTYTYNSESYQEGFTSGSLNNISQVTYGNGATYYQSYDSVGRLGSVRNVAYGYNKYNQVSLKNNTGGDWSQATYSYDMAGRIISQIKSMFYDGSFMYSMSFKYKDKTNLLEKYRFATAYDSLTTSFVYGNINSGQIPEAVYGVKLNGTQRLGYTYDNFARQISRTLYAGSTAIPKTYSYKTVENSTGYLVDTISEGGYTYNYSYDALGNITAYTKKNSATGQVLETAVYRYDDKNQLVFAGTSDTVGTAYTYDANGNILTKTNTATNATISYGYTDPTWADLLTSYNGQTITYDEVGNPINYRNGMTFGWAMDSRNLETVTIGENVYNYSYTGEGERAAKYVGDVSYQYKFFDGVLYAESRYDMFGETLIYYFYDENGTMYGFSYNGTPYYYRLNLQGDVTGIYDSNGQLVTEYTYDEWGKVLTVTGSMADTVGQANAIRYRGYYYDSETGFYYLQTRYYDPETGRFLNADGFISTGQDITSYNMFAYCGNNPVNFYDPDGNLKLSSLFNIIVSGLKISISMFKQAINGDGKKQIYSSDSDISKALSKSKIMQTEVSKNLESHIASGETFATYQGSVSLYGKDNSYDFDLSYSVGKASYTMTIKEETKTSGFWFFKKIKHRYVINVTVSDIYDFDEYRDDKSMGSILNNLGYDMQQLGFLKPYAWEATYTVYQKWR